MQRKTNLSYKKCNRCGWVHFSLPESECRKAVREFNVWFVQQSFETQDSYGGLARITDYTNCFFCREPWTNFSDAEDGDVPDGSTIQPIMVKDNEETY